MQKEVEQMLSKIKEDLIKLEERLNVLAAKSSSLDNKLTIARSEYSRTLEVLEESSERLTPLRGVRLQVI
jgi:archaellum component FlaC